MMDEKVLAVRKRLLGKKMEFLRSYFRVKAYMEDHDCGHSRILTAYTDTLVNLDRQLREL